MTVITERRRYSLENGKGESIAHLEVDERSGVYWLTNLWVDPDHRKKGLATLLLTRCVWALANADVYLMIQPYTDQPMDAVLLAAFYRRFGFQATSVPSVLHRLAGTPAEAPDVV
jgi:GNAT superfamily N-acetyltransferase